MKKFAIALGAASLAIPVEAWAQDTVVVTGSRIERSDYDEYFDDDQSAIGLTRTADYFVKPIYVNSDSRDAGVRRTEVNTMLEATIALAESKGISLVAGEYKLAPLTLETMDDLVSYGRGSRPDTTRVKIYARLPVGGVFEGVDAVDQAVRAFKTEVPVTGRAYMETGSTNLAIDDPDQYRGAVVKAIADEAKRYAAMFGSDYGIEIRGLDSELYFNQASQTELFLYIEHNFVIKPK
jgi:hypothetical protein